MPDFRYGVFQSHPQSSSQFYDLSPAKFDTQFEGVKNQCRDLMNPAEKKDPVTLAESDYWRSRTVAVDSTEPTWTRSTADNPWNMIADLSTTHIERGVHVYIPNHGIAKVTSVVRRTRSHATFRVQLDGTCYVHYIRAPYEWTSKEWFEAYRRILAHRAKYCMNGQPTDGRAAIPAAARSEEQAEEEEDQCRGDGECIGITGTFALHSQMRPSHSLPW